MEFILEFVFDILFELIEVGSTSDRIPKPLKYLCMFLVASFLIGILSLVGYFAFGLLKKGEVLGGLTITALFAFFGIKLVLNFRKQLVKRNEFE